MSDNAQSPRYVLATHLPTIRARVGLSSARELAERVSELGGRLDRAAISKIESKTRNVSLDEALQLAVALDVSPAHLFFPLNDDACVELAPGLAAVSAVDARAWFRGQQPLHGQDEKTYRSAWMPDSEWRAFVAKTRESG